MIFTLPTPPEKPQTLDLRPNQEAIDSRSFFTSSLERIFASNSDSLFTYETGVEVFSVEIVNPTAATIHMPWTGQMTKRFRELARKQAIGTAAAAELEEFEQLQRMRQIREDPPTPEAIFAEFERQRAMQEIHEVLERYSVVFTEPNQDRHDNPQGR